MCPDLLCEAWVGDQGAGGGFDGGEVGIALGKAARDKENGAKSEEREAGCGVAPEERRGRSDGLAEGLSDESPGEDGEDEGDGDGEKGSGNRECVGGGHAEEGKQRPVPEVPRVGDAADEDERREGDDVAIDEARGQSDEESSAEDGGGMAAGPGKGEWGVRRKRGARMRVRARTARRLVASGGKLHCLARIARPFFETPQGGWGTRPDWQGDARRGGAALLEDGKGHADAEFPGAVWEQVESLHGGEADVVGCKEPATERTR